VKFLFSVRKRFFTTIVVAPLLGSLNLSAQSGQTVKIVRPSAFTISRALRDLAPVSPASGPAQEATSRTASKNLALLLNVPGSPDTDYIYPDSNGAVGATQYMQWTNARYEIYSKTNGKKILGPISAKLLWATLGGECATTNAGDGIINYDKAAQRWVVTHHTGGGVPYLQCVAVSTTSDATGSYYLYAFQLTSTYYPDYPQLGVWSDAYYVTANLLTPSGFANVAGQVCALNRADMLIGSANATAQCLQTTTNTAFSVLQPADLDGSTAPPSGAPNYLMALDNNSIDLYAFHVNWVTPADTTLTLTANLPVTPFTEACNGAMCIPQEGSTEVLDGVGDRLLHRLAYRNMGSYDTMVITHSVVSGSSVGVRWYEIRNPGTAPAVYQQGTYAPDSNYRWLGSLAMDHMGDLAVGYSVSSSSMYPSIRATGRLSTDALGTLEPELTIFSGTGAQTASGNDWGNASSMSIDPVDDCTFWYTNEYLVTTGTSWDTRLATLKFPACP
jgi:hypothetical protein